MSSQPPSWTPRTSMPILFGILAGFAMVWGIPAAGATPPDPTNTTVRYELTGPAVAGYVTYQTAAGQNHEANVPLPWSTQFTNPVGSSNSATSLVSAQGVGPGLITCTVEVGGKVVSRNTATGNPPRVVCEHHWHR